MGNQQPKPTVKKPSFEDNMIEMKLQSKSLARAAKKSEKQMAAYQKKAKEALKKNNEQAAKMYLMSASAKKNEALNCQRTAMKMQFMCDKIKSMKSNQKLMNTFGAMTAAVNQSMQNFDPSQMMQNMQQFNTKMDELMINNKMMMQIADTGQIQMDATVDQMKQALMNEIAMEEKNKLAGDEVKYQKQHNQEQDQFLNQLKGL